MHYHLDTLLVDSRTVLGMKFIESINFPDGVDLTADILKDDLHLNVVMISGKEYSISVELQRKALNDGSSWSLDSVRVGIYEKWKSLIRVK